MRDRGTSLAARLIPASSETEVLFHDLAVLLVLGVQPAADSFGRKASIRERTGELPSLAQHAGHVSKHFYGSREVVDRNAAHHGVTSLQMGVVAPFQSWSIWPMVFVCDGAYSQFPWHRIFISLVDAPWPCCPARPFLISAM